MGKWQDKLARLDSPTATGGLTQHNDGDDSTPMGLASFTPGSGVPGEVAEGERLLDSSIEQLGIVGAYRRWCGKSEPDESRTESIMVSCPIPGHADRNPSAWLNSDKGVWHCGACDTGGDIYDIASYHFGITGYKTSGKSFHALRKAIGQDLGYSFFPTVSGLEEPVPPGGTPQAVRNEEKRRETRGRPPRSIETLDDAVDYDSLVNQRTTEGPGGLEARPLAAVPMPPTELSPEDLEDFESIVAEEGYEVGPNLPLAELCPPNTFLESYIAATSVDDSPDEFHYANALIALSLLAGRNVSLEGDGEYYPTLYVCLLGETGIGKSKARKYLTRLLTKTFPYVPGKGDTEGVSILPTPGSGEALIDMLRNTHDTGGAVPLAEGDIRAYLDFDEMSTMLSKMKRQNSTLRETLLSLYDAPAALDSHTIGQGRKEAMRPFCALTTSTQPDRVRATIDREDSAAGLLNRFIFISGTPKELRALGASNVDLTKAEAMLGQLRRWLTAERRAHGDRVWVEFTDDGLKAWNKLFFDKLAPMKRGKAGTGEAGTRADFICKKLLMLYALNSQRKHITADDVFAVSKLLERLEHTWKFIASEASRGEIITGAEQADMERDIIRYVGEAYREDATKPITTWKVKRQFADRGWTLKEVQGVMNSLQQSGLLAEAQIRGRRGKGRPPADPVVPVGIKPGNTGGDDGVWVAKQ